MSAASLKRRSKRRIGKSGPETLWRARCWKFEAEGGFAGPGSEVDAPGASSGPGRKIQEVSRVGAQSVTSKSKLLAQEMPDLHTGGLRVDSGAARSRKGARAGQRVDRRGSYASVGPEWKIQEVSRLGAQGVTSKSKLLAREMPDLHTGGLRVGSRAALSLEVAFAKAGLKSTLTRCRQHP